MYFNLVYWKAIDLIIYLVPRLYRMWILKHMSGFRGVNYIMFNIKSLTDLGCPCWCEPGIKDTTQHKLCCISISKIMREGVE